MTDPNTQTIHYPSGSQEVTENNAEIMNDVEMQQQQQVHMVDPTREQSLHQQVHQVQGPSNVANMPNVEQIVAFDVVKVQEYIIAPYEFFILSYGSTTGVADNQMTRTSRSMFTAAYIQRCVNKINQMLFNFNLSGQPSMKNGENRLGSLCVLYTFPPQNQELMGWDIPTSIRCDHFARLVLDMAPLPDPLAVKGKKVLDLLMNVRKMDDDIYRMANSKLEYHNVVTKIIHKIQKKIDKRRQKWKEQQLQAQQQQQSTDISDYDLLAFSNNKAVLPSSSKSETISCEMATQQNTVSSVTTFPIATVVAASSSSTADITKSDRSQSE